MSTQPVENLVSKGCCGDGRRVSQSGGEDGGRGSRGDGGWLVGAEAGRRRLRVAAGPPVGSGLRAGYTLHAYKLRARHLKVYATSILARSS